MFQSAGLLHLLGSTAALPFTLAGYVILGTALLLWPFSLPLKGTGDLYTNWEGGDLPLGESLHFVPLLSFHFQAFLLLAAFRGSSYFNVTRPSVSA